MGPARHCERTRTGKAGKSVRENTIREILSILSDGFYFESVFMMTSGGGSLKACDVVSDYWVMDPFDFDFTNLLHLHEISDSTVGPLTNQDLSRFGKRFEAGSHIDLVSDDGIVLVDI